MTGKKILKEICGLSAFFNDGLFAAGKIAHGR
jgi:hypothetical protein